MCISQSTDDALSSVCTVSRSGHSASPRTVSFEKVSGQLMVPSAHCDFVSTVDPTDHLRAVTTEEAA